MPEASSASLTNAERKDAEPNYIGYYISEIVELCSQNEDLFSSLYAQTSELPGRTCAIKGGGTSEHSCSRREPNCLTSFCSSFNSGIGDGLSDCKRERLKASLKQCVVILGQEVDEILNPVLSICQIRKHLRDKERLLSNSSASDEDENLSSCKKQKISTSPSLAETSGCGSQRGVNEDLQFLLENDAAQIQEALKKYSDELSEKLGHLEQQLEELLDVVMSKCRSMTLAEKQQLLKLIQKLPQKNLDRVAEIVQHNKFPKRDPSDEIHVDLEKEDNVTLWRLYYYTKAVENAKKLAKSE